MRKPDRTEPPWNSAQMEKDCWLLLRVAVLLGQHPGYLRRDAQGAGLRWARAHLIDLADRFETARSLTRLFDESEADP